MLHVFVRHRTLLVVPVVIISLCSAACLLPEETYADTTTNPQSGSVGLQGTITESPPTTSPTIAVPSNGKSFTTEPITFSGLCTGTLLVELFSNGVFIGSAQCAQGSFTIQAALFAGQNQVIARYYDALGQAGPDSSPLTATLTNTAATATQQVLVTSVYATRGATPGTQLSWPLTLSGGTPPYAVSIDWGDGSTPSLISEQTAGTFTATHTYQTAGVYTVLVKATDANGAAGFLQLVGVGSGTITQGSASSSSSGSSVVVTKTKLLWWPALLSLPLLCVAFWLGMRYSLTSLRRHLNESREQE